MNRQGNVLNKEQYTGAPIERAHLHKGFNAKKTPIKWIRFFRACVLQREVAEEKKSKLFFNIKGLFLTLIFSFGIFWILNLIGLYKIPILDHVSIFGGIFIVFLLFIIRYVIFSQFDKKFNKKFAEGFDFFADYFSAFFTLIEEDLQPNSKITLVANLKDTISDDNFIRRENYNNTSRGFVSGKENYYEKVISKGSCFFNDGSLVSFQFTERMRQRIVEKRGRVSGKRKTKYKYRAAYPFILKMRIPKNKYQLNPTVNKEQVNLVEEDTHYVFKAMRKFDAKTENRYLYNPSVKSSITTFEVDYFSLEVINLINTCYSCVTPRA